MIGNSIPQHDDLGFFGILAMFETVIEYMKN